MNQLPWWHSIIILIGISYFISCNAQERVLEHCIVAYADRVINKEAIANCFTKDISVVEISFVSDVVFSRHEFMHLLGFKESDSINYHDIIAALERFIKKNKFSVIKIHSEINIEHNKVRLSFTFEGELTFRKIKIHHVYRGKDVFRQFYIMERGDVFDQAKHEYSIDQIKEFLIDSGYLSGQVHSSFECDDATKEVVVHLFIKKGTCFSCGTLAVDMVHDNEMYDDYEDMCKRIRTRILHACAGHCFTKMMLDSQIQQLKDYLAKKGFSHSDIEIEKDIDYRRTLVNIQLKLILQQKREIIFFGHRFFSKKELRDKILAFGQSVWLLPATLLAEEIIKEYKNKGFLRVEVTTQEEKERSFFIIKEGERARIKSVEIKNGTLPDQDLIIDNCFKKLLKHTHFDIDLYNTAISSLTKIYHERGFLIFVALDYECIATAIENEYILRIFVDEGARKYITQVVVQDHPELHSQGPFASFAGCAEDEKKIIFDTNSMELQRTWLVKHFQSLGYMHPRIKPIIQTRDEDVSIVWTIEKGEKVHFGKTIVQGSSSFPFSCLEHFLFYQEGELWDQRKVQQSFKALKDLEIFETIHFSADHSSAGEDKPIILKLHLDDRYEIRARAGLELQHVRKYQTFSAVTYKVGGTMLIKNPTSSGDQLRFDCDFARPHREVVAKYRRPWLCKSPFFIDLQVYSIMYDQIGFRVDSKLNDVYKVIQNGFLCGLEKKMQHFDFGWNNGCEWMKLQIKADEVLLSFARAIDFKPQFIDKSIPFFFTEPTIMLERLDDALSPTRGGITLFSLKMMLPLIKKYKDSFFFKGLFEQSLFVPIRNVVMALRFRCGHIFYREFSGIMPSERFYLGGSHSLRGYESDLAPPLGVFVDDDGKHHIVPRGGKTMLNTNVELRFPVWRKIGGVIFQDLGALSGTMFADFKTQDLLAATGFGVRIFTPLGPLRFDIGWRWRKQLVIERSFAWFLTFGQAF